MIQRLALAAVLAVCMRPAASHQIDECLQWYEALDQAVQQADVRDALYARVEGFPYLRIDALHAMLRERAARAPRALQAFVERLGQLDLDARRHEILNLPPSGLAALSALEPDVTPGRALNRTAECGRLLRELDLARAPKHAALLEAARTPPLSPMRERSGRDASPSGPMAVRFAPPPGPMPRARVAGMLAHARFDPLGVPQISALDLANLATAYAPSLEIAIAGDHDRFGELRWPRRGEAPEVNASEAVVYVRAAYAAYRGHMLLQLIYTIWFPENQSLAWRVTLAPDGEPLLYDAIPPCACYQQFFATPRARPLAQAPVRELPRLAEDERPMLKLTSGSHEIEQVALVRGTDSLARYALRPYDELRSLQRLDGGRRSAVAAHAAPAQSDDPRLLERSFELDLGA